MANLSNYFEEQILTEKLVNSTVYVGLVDDTAIDGDLESGDLTNEITSYTGDRKSVNFTTPTQTDGKATIENSGDIDFQEMPADTIKYAIICDSATTGNILYWCPASSLKTTNDGDTYRIPTGDLTITLD